MILVAVVVVVVGPHQAKEEDFLTETIKILEESLDILDRLTGIGHVMLQDAREEWA